MRLVKKLNMISEGDSVRVKSEFSAIGGEVEFEGVVDEVCGDGSIVVETENSKVTEVFTTGKAPVSEDDVVEIK